MFTRIGLGLLIVELTLGGLFTWATFDAFRRAAYREASENLRQTTRALADAYDRLHREAPDELPERAHDDARLFGLRIDVFDSEGQAIASAGPRALPNPVPSSPARSIELERLGEPLHGVLRATASSNEPGGIVLIAQEDASGFVAIAWSRARGSIAFGLSALVVLGLIVFVALFRLRVRLLKISRIATRFAAGDLRHRVPDAPTQEFAVLTDTLNHMARQLDEQIAELRAQRNERETVLRSVGDGLLALDPRQQVLSLNRAAESMLGVRESDVRGRPLREAILHPELIHFLHDAQAANKTISEELTLSGPDGRSVRATANALANATDEQVGLLLVLSDLTEVRRLEAVRADFAANVSHELRTPITNIKGYVETLLDTPPAEPEQRDRFLRVVQRNADRLGEIVSDMLTLTRLERPEATSDLATAPVRVADVVASVCREYTLSEHGVRCDVRTDVPDELSMFVNRQLVEQALGNLITNAMKYGPPEGPVYVSARATTPIDGRGMVELAVKDSGPGIAEEHLPRLFERFYRVDKARSRDEGGTGLGLAIVKHIALIHGGRVLVESRLGEGSTFRVILPSEPARVVHG
ncbi:MAG: ATP-binding protein [Planctomycetota bacterium]